MHPENVTLDTHCNVKAMITYLALIWVNRTEVSTIARDLQKLRRLACMIFFVGVGVTGRTGRALH